MDVIWYNANDYNKKLKATIQSSGKLGFTDDTAKELNLSEDTYIRIGADQNDKSLMYLVVVAQSDMAFKVCKAGEYYYLPTTRLFLALGFDFQAKNKTIMFDLTRAEELDEELQGVVYKMNKREIEKRRK